MPLHAPVVVAARCGRILLPCLGRLERRGRTGRTRGDTRGPSDVPWRVDAPLADALPPHVRELRRWIEREADLLRPESTRSDVGAVVLEGERSALDAGGDGTLPVPAQDRRPELVRPCGLDEADIGD